MKDLILTDNQFNPEGYWTEPVGKLIFIPTYEDVDLFDQNGYDLTILEQHFMSTNALEHRSHRHAVKQDWFQQKLKLEGAVLNHSLLFERKAYAGAAREQLVRWSRDLPLVNKIVSIRPKWGLDFSMDYVDRSGNAFEILHWEYDGFDYNEIQSVKEYIEPVLLNIDWDDAGKEILNHKDQWHHLDFFAQSDWKCQYFGIPRERFKMVIWQ
jgi:hypothetical protein